MSTYVEMYVDLRQVILRAKKNNMIWSSVLSIFHRLEKILINFTEIKQFLRIQPCNLDLQFQRTLFVNIF